MSSITFKREAMGVLPDGMTETQEIEINLDVSTGMFTASLPEHVSEMFEDYRIVTGTTLQDVVQTYEGDCDTYSRRRLGKMPRPMLLITQTGGDYDLEGIACSVGLGMHEVLVDFSEDNEVETIYKRGSTNNSIGARLGATLGAWNYTLMQDRPEIRAKYKELATSIQRADDILMQMVNVDHPTTGMEDYFLSISYDNRNPGVPAAETETTEPATSDPAQPELPFSTTPEDDEEL